MRAFSWTCIEEGSEIQPTVLRSRSQYPGLLYETVASTVGYLKALGIHVRKAKVAVVLYELGSEINEFKDKERVDA